MHILVQLVKQVLLSFLTLFVKSNRPTITLLCIRLSETLAVLERCMAKTPLYMASLFLPNTDDRYALFFLDQDVCGFQEEPCHSNAECVNRHKAFVCSCAAGFIEDIGSCNGKCI